ncbi:MAG: hypothetical protein P0S96_03375 [Simkaniaceae bacterium]|nr:hypothetical protein [Candidatus Sacchlamyda saccharinae]
MDHALLAHLIEELLLSAHVEREAGIDLIDEYFSSQSSLDPITRYASKLLQEIDDPSLQESILKNLSECIVVKMQYEKKSLTGFVRKIFTKIGLDLQNGEVKRAEQLVRNYATIEKVDSLVQD